MISGISNWGCSCSWSSVQVGFLWSWLTVVLLKLLLNWDWRPGKNFLKYLWNIKTEETWMRSEKNNPEGKQSKLRTDREWERSLEQENARKMLILKPSNSHWLVWLRSRNDKELLRTGKSSPTVLWLIKVIFPSGIWFLLRVEISLNSSVYSYKDTKQNKSGGQATQKYKIIIKIKVMPLMFNKWLNHHAVIIVNK